MKAEGRQCAGFYLMQRALVMAATRRGRVPDTEGWMKAEGKRYRD
jgi:hypothetical protein